MLIVIHYSPTLSKWLQLFWIKQEHIANHSKWWGALWVLRKSVSVHQELILFQFPQIFDQFEAEASLMKASESQACKSLTIKQHPESQLCNHEYVPGRPSSTGSVIDQGPQLLRSEIHLHVSNLPQAPPCQYQSLWVEYTGRPIPGKCRETPLWASFDSRTPWLLCWNFLSLHVI